MCFDFVCKVVTAHACLDAMFIDLHLMCIAWLSAVCVEIFAVDTSIRLLTVMTDEVHLINVTI
jgi:hypothetical protein